MSQASDLSKAVSSAELSFAGPGCSSVGQEQGPAGLELRAASAAGASLAEGKNGVNLHGKRELSEGSAPDSSRCRQAADALSLRSFTLRGAGEHY